MSVRECVVRGGIASEHIVQFFDSDESRAECVAAFLAEGCRAGEPTIVVAKPANWAAVVAELEAQGLPVDKAIADGMIVVKDANDTLRRISRNGSPNAEAFEAVIGRALKGLARSTGRIRAYGEMVDMLAQRGELADAIKLEGLWNRIGERVPFFLLCGYSAAHFVATATHRALREICAAHSDVHRHAQDPLATWLLNSAHNAPGAASVTH
jgi:MEDS: MEthanogen/methylotroph, DcmR Sensory domain